MSNATFYNFDLDRGVDLIWDLTLQNNGVGFPLTNYSGTGYIKPTNKSPITTAIISVVFNPEMSVLGKFQVIFTKEETSKLINDKYYYYTKIISPSNIHTGLLQGSITINN